MLTANRIHGVIDRFRHFPAWRLGTSRTSLRRYCDYPLLLCILPAATAHRHLLQLAHGRHGRVVHFFSFLHSTFMALSALLRSIVPTRHLPDTHFVYSTPIRQLDTATSWALISFVLFMPILIRIFLCPLRAEKSSHVFEEEFKKKSRTTTEQAYVPSTTSTISPTLRHRHSFPTSIISVFISVYTEWALCLRRPSSVVIPVSPLSFQHSSLNPQIHKRIFSSSASLGHPLV
jgi:hypothetical protein